MTLIAVNRILSERGGGVIFAGTIVGREKSEADVRVRASADALAGAPTIGELWEIAGDLRQTQWGPQIEARSAIRSMPTGELLKGFLASHVAGIGKERSERLWTHYGAELSQVLDDGDVAALAVVIAPDRPLLGPRLAAAVVRSWKQAANEARLVTWCQKRGIDDLRAVRRIGAILRDRAVETLERNPWLLVSLMPWAKVDEIGLRIRREASVPDPSTLPERLVGAVDGIAKDVIATGATMLSGAALRTQISDRIGEPLVDAAIEAGRRNGALVPSAGDWRVPGCAMMEDAVERRLRDVAALVHVRRRLAAGFEPLVALANYEAAAGALHPEQREAVLKVFQTPFACLRGGAGVGKTHVTRAVCHMHEKAGGNVVLATVAGKAALRLSKATGRLARTLFRTIRELDERRNIEEALQGDVPAAQEIRMRARLETLAEITPDSLVILDEASMVDLATLHALQRRMPAGARLLMVGDERQLPPVGFGLVFHRVVDDAKVTATLRTVHRQAANSGIPAVAATVRDRKLPELDGYRGSGEGVFLVEAKDPAAIADGVVRVYQDLVGEDPLVVTPVKGGPAGVRSLNAMLHELHVEAERGAEIRTPLGDRISVGEPVVHDRNDYTRGLFNGSIGRVSQVDGSAGTLVATFDGEEQEFDADALIDLSLGYALTCHRAQGSQASRVIVALPRARMLDPSWLYTAITRAERQVVIVGSRETLSHALAQPWAADRREVGFRWC